MLAIFHCIYIYLTIKSAMDVNENGNKIVENHQEILYSLLSFLFSISSNQQIFRAPLSLVCAI